MRKRQQINQRRAKKQFTRTAARVHPRNIRQTAQQRGGVRL